MAKQNFHYYCVRSIAIVFGLCTALLGVICIFGFLLLGRTDNPELVANRFSLFTKTFLISLLGAIAWGMWANSLKE